MTSSHDKYRKKSIDGCRECPPRKACEGAEISLVGTGCVEGGGEFTLRQPNDQEIEFHVDCPGNGKLAIKTCESLEGGGDFYANAKCNEDITLCINNEWLHKFVMSRVCNGELKIITTDDMKGGGAFTANQCNNTNIVLGVNWEKFPACEGGGIVLQNGCWAIDKGFIQDLLPEPEEEAPAPPGATEKCNDAGTCCITGNGQTGQTLTAEHKDCSGKVTYQWQERKDGSWEDISGANGSSYTPSSTGTYRCQMVCTTSRSAESLEASTGCIGCKDPTREDLEAELRHLAINSDRIHFESSPKTTLGGDVDSHCVDFDEKDCSPFRWDCMIDNARICAGGKGVVDLKVSTHGCNSRCGDPGNGGGKELSYEWEWSKEKNDGYKTLQKGNSSLEFKLNMISWKPEAGDKIWIRAISKCDDHPKNQVIVGGGGSNGGQPIKIDVIECCDGDVPCPKNKPQCCNKKDHPDQPEGCQECCKNKHCDDGKECINGKCKDKSDPDPDPDPDPGPSEKQCNTPAVGVEDAPSGGGDGGGGGSGGDSDNGPKDDGSGYPFLYTRMWGEIHAKNDKTKGEAELGHCSKTTDDKNCVSIHKAEFVDQQGKQESWMVTLKFANKLPTANYIVNATVKKGSYDHTISYVNDKNDGFLDPKEGFTVIIHDVENNTSMPGSDSRQNSNHVCDFSFSVLW